MKNILRIALAAAIAFACTTVSAQTNDFRAPGYKGSVSLIDQYGVWAGLETSHGIMFDRHNYLGAGMSVSFCLPELGETIPIFGQFFVDYQNYLLDKKSTPVLGVKAGYMKALNEKKTTGWNFTQAAFIEPDLGWNWAMKNGCGFTTSLGASMFKPIGDSNKDFCFMPRLSLTFEF